ncbi:hypothetical protein ACL9RL_03330 [Plantibacter sp. Mn2098]|uniref:hypothetical protein n=1 Tax=Plantibacter sp. Mn2098 TaxID=3395266 RepID=UPI003BD3A09A
MTPNADASPRRIELTLRKPWLGWFPKPTVVFEGRGHPAQWGTGTWQLRSPDATTIEVYLYNRMWRFGEASATVAGADADVNTKTDSAAPVSLVYRAPWLPFLRGSLQASRT